MTTYEVCTCPPKKSCPIHGWRTVGTTDSGPDRREECVCDDEAAHVMGLCPVHPPEHTTPERPIPPRVVAIMAEALLHGLDPMVVLAQRALEDPTLLEDTDVDD